MEIQSHVYDYIQKVTRIEIEPIKSRTINTSSIPQLEITKKKAYDHLINEVRIVIWMQTTGGN